MLVTEVCSLTIFFLLAITTADNLGCDLYLAPSTLPGAGRGIISGKSFKYDEIVEETVSVSMRSETSLNSQLNNYVFGMENEHFTSIIFGGGVLYNHMPTKTVQHYASEKVLVDPAENPTSHTTANNIKFIAEKAIKVGEEIYSNYGEIWFESRNMVEQDVQKNLTGKNSVAAPDRLLTLEELQQYGHCLTHVEIRPSTISLAGNGLFAKKSYVKGEVVSIAPVLTLPRQLVQDSADSSVLMNYCITSPGGSSDVTLFPLNNAVLVNHQPADLANLDMRWYDWSAVPSTGAYYEHLVNNALNLTAKLAQSPKDIFSASFAPFDIAYVASRDIAEGEELTYNYGDNWAAEWEKFQGQLYAWEKGVESEDEMSKVTENMDDFADVRVFDDDNRSGTVSVTHREKPIFRSFIDAPSDLFPVHWLRKEGERSEL